MKNSKHLQSLLTAVIVVTLFIGAHAISLRSEKPPLFISKQQSTVNLNNDILSYINLGQKRLISSILWIATILESDHEHYKNKDLNSWMFLRFNTISLLEPQFREVYSFGGPYLSIIKDDLEGASYIYRRGLKYYPNDHSILSNAGFHFYFEVGDDQESEPIFERLLNHKKSPPWILTTLTKIKAGKGNKTDALIFLNEYQDKFSSHKLLAEKIYEYRYALKAEIDLECLNSKKFKECSLKDLDNNPYRIVNGIYISNKNYPPVSSRNKKRE